MKVLLLVTSLIALSWAEEFDTMGEWGMENPDLFEGDILGIDSMEDRTAITSKSKRWPKGVVRYTIEGILRNRGYIDNITAAMRHITEKTSRCITFESLGWVSSEEEDEGYIKIYPGNGCYSHVGFQQFLPGGQELSLAPGCLKIGTIVHELMHAIGFYHEHSRSDRDDYVIIHWDNIKDDFKGQFAMMRETQHVLYDGFDYKSIMLYGSRAFSKGKGLKTIEAKEPGVKLKSIHKKGGLSSSDIYRIKKLYECKV